MPEVLYQCWPGGVAVCPVTGRAPPAMYRRILLCLPSLPASLVMRRYCVVVVALRRGFLSAQILQGLLDIVSQTRWDCIVDYMPLGWSFSVSAQST